MKEKIASRRQFLIAAALAAGGVGCAPVASPSTPENPKPIKTQVSATSETPKTPETTSTSIPPTAEPTVVTEQPVVYDGKIRLSEGIPHFPEWKGAMTENPFTYPDVHAVEILPRVPEDDRTEITFYAVVPDKQHPLDESLDTVEVIRQRLPVGTTLMVRAYNPLEMEVDGPVTGNVSLPAHLGEVIGYTGDTFRRVWMEVGAAEINGAHEIVRKPLAQIVESDVPHIGALYLVRHRIYDNKIFNIMLEATRILEYTRDHGRMLPGYNWNLFEVTNFVEQFNGTHVPIEERVLPGYNSQEVVVPAGGICAGPSLTMKAASFANLQQEGSGNPPVFSFDKYNLPHSHLLYDLNQDYWPVEKNREYDATMEYMNQNFGMTYEGDAQNAPYIHAAFDVSYLSTESPYKTYAWNPLYEPATVWFAFVMYMNNTPVSDAEVAVATEAREHFRQYIRGNPPPTH